MPVTQTPIRPIGKLLGPKSTQARAFASPSTHVFRRGVGYIELGKPAAPNLAPAGRCNPPVDAADQSWHGLLPPGGSRPIMFQWFAKPKAWVRLTTSARRLGFEPDYLSQAGWTYKGAANGPH